PPAKTITTRLSSLTSMANPTRREGYPSGEGSHVSFNLVGFFPGIIPLLCHQETRCARWLCPQNCWPVDCSRMARGSVANCCVRPNGFLHWQHYSRLL